MVSIESDCTDGMQTTQESREEASQLGRNQDPKGNRKSKVRPQTGSGFDGEEMCCQIEMLRRIRVVTRVTVQGSE